MNSSKKWKSFDFKPSKKLNDEEDSLDVNVTELIEKKTPTKPINKIDFFHKLKPKKVEELAVHPKKIEEVKLWFETVFSNTFRFTPILLITGPTGSGKAATVNVICETMDILIREWINTIDYDYDLNRTSNQVIRFMDFLITEASYKSLFSSSDKKYLLLVKDFPNVFLTNHEEFINVLEECYHHSNCPVVFILTDSNNSNINNQLFPEEIKSKFSITHISFNSCAPTVMKKCLKRAQTVVESLKGSFKVPSSDVVDSILAGSMGDIRSAIGQYYFASVLGNEFKMGSKVKKQTRSGKNTKKQTINTDKIMGKDQSLGLFHGLGRVLNPKIIEREKTWRLDCDVNTLVSEFEGQPNMLVSFLFQNYPKYFGDLTDACRGVEKLSDANLFLQKWFEGTSLNEYPVWISVLGLMINNRHRLKSWNPIRKPEKIIKRTSEYSAMDDYYFNVIKKV